MVVRRGSTDVYFLTILGKYPGCWWRIWRNKNIGHWKGAVSADSERACKKVTNCTCGMFEIKNNNFSQVGSRKNRLRAVLLFLSPSSRKQNKARGKNAMQNPMERCVGKEACISPPDFLPSLWAYVAVCAVCYLLWVFSHYLGFAKRGEKGWVKEGEEGGRVGVPPPLPFCLTPSPLRRSIALAPSLQCFPKPRRCLINTRWNIQHSLAQNTPVLQARFLAAFFPLALFPFLLTGLRERGTACNQKKHFCLCPLFITHMRLTEIQAKNIHTDNIL